jgi:hypothetical protein
MKAELRTKRWRISVCVLRARKWRELLVEHLSLSLYMVHTGSIFV